MSDNLKKGVSILYDMELNNYLMTKSIGELNQKISQLRQRLPFYAPEKPKNKCSIKKDMGSSIATAVIISSILAVLLIIILWPLFKNFDSNDQFLLIMTFVYPVICVGAAIGILSGRKKGLKKKNKEQEKIDIEYKKEYDKQLNQLALVQQDNMRQSNLLFAEKESLIKRKAEATQKLNEFYEAVGIDEKFRNIVPIGYMNDFLRLGIANRLEGADGLYYLIMKELRWDQLQHSLEDISYRLDAVIDHQKALYHELVAMNYKCDELVRLAEQEAKMAVRRQQTLEQIEHNTSVAAYNAKRVEKEVEFNNFMHINHM